MELEGDKCKTRSDKCKFSFGESSEYFFPEA